MDPEFQKTWEALHSYQVLGLNPFNALHCRHPHIIPGWMVTNDDIFHEDVGIVYAPETRLVYLQMRSPIRAAVTIFDTPPTQVYLRAGKLRLQVRKTELILPDDIAFAYALIMHWPKFLATQSKTNRTKATFQLLRNFLSETNYDGHIQTAH